MKKNDPVDIIGVIGFIIYQLTLISAMVFLMVHFNHWWPVFILLGSGSFKHKSNDDNEKPDIEEEEGMFD